MIVQGKESQVTLGESRSDTERPGKGGRTEQVSSREAGGQEDGVEMKIPSLLCAALLHLLRGPQ